MAPAFGLMLVLYPPVDTAVAPMEMGPLVDRPLPTAVHNGGLRPLADSVVCRLAGRFKGRVPTWATSLLISSPRLQAKRGRQLVIVSYGPRHNFHEEWVYNEADIDRAVVVWARDLGAAKNRKLLDYFKDRHVWVCKPDQSPVRLVPYRVPPEENGPVKAVSPGRASQADPVRPFARMTAHAR